MYNYIYKVGEMLMKLNQKQARILSSTLTVFSIFMIGSGIVLNIQNKPIVNTKYVVSVEKKWNKS